MKKDEENNKNKILSLNFWSKRESLDIDRQKASKESYLIRTLVVCNEGKLEKFS